MDTVIEQVLADVKGCVSQVATEDLLQAGTLLENSSRIFVAGAGRSGLCMRALAMRLMHLGKTVFVLGETTTPGIVATDLLILGSGSGQTASLLVMTEKARLQGAKILLFTTDSTSPLAKWADHRVIIPAPSLKKVRNVDSFASVQPMGTLFEQVLLILSDSLILWLMERAKVSTMQMLERHFNLE